MRCDTIYLRFSELYRGLLLLTIFALAASVAADDWELLEDKDDRYLEARILSVKDGKVTFLRKSDGRRFEMEVGNFSAATRERFKEFESALVEEAQSEADGGFSKKLYPHTRSKIKEVIREIEGRDKADGIDSDQHKTITELNIYRFLCGVPYDVEADPKIVEQATEAAEACKKHGDLSHDIGSYTNKCNLSTRGDITATPRGYIQDNGANNREARGHRRWCLNPPMEKTGFGSGGSQYSAMWAMDSGGKRNSESWAYPGKGFFPVDRLHGNGWSLYLTERAPAAKELEVKVFKLSKRPETTIPWSDEPEGRELSVDYVSTYLNAINFEPDEKPITGRGIYYVRVEGGSVREQYLVELY
jgi:hypothetical protein